MLFSSMTTSSPSISPGKLHGILNSRARFQLVDVRTGPEFATAHIAGACLVPLDELSNRLAEINKDRAVVLVCRSGKRSAQARQTLLRSGFEDVCDLAGGIIAWQEAGFPVREEPCSPAHQP
jgi:sulfur dioxygenase